MVRSLRLDADGSVACEKKERGPGLASPTALQQARGRMRRSDSALTPLVRARQ